MTDILHKQDANDRHWFLLVGLTLTMLAVTVALFWSTATSAVALWSSRSAYNHGFLILPISLYLIWDKRHVLTTIEPRPFHPGLIIIVGSVAAWIVARAMNILEGEHFALVGMFQGIVLTVLGLNLFRALILPMTFLWLMVPTGTIFYPLLQKIATVLSVFLLDVSGIPVFSQGYQVEVPSALYIIAQGCSGLNFLLTGLAMSLLYSYVMYTNLRKRLMAIGVMLLVALFANAIRIFFIIALAEWSNQKVDIVDDHIIYGWGFFAIILVIMGIIGMRFADPVRPMKTDRPAVGFKRVPLVIACAFVFVGLAFGPFYDSFMLQNERNEKSVEVLKPIDEIWEMVGVVSSWHPRFQNPNGELRGRIAASPHVEVYVAYYASQWPGHELVSNGNYLFDPDHWWKISEENRSLPTPAGEVEFGFVHLRSINKERLVAYSHWVDGKYTASALVAKTRQAKASLLRGRPDAALISVSLPIDSDTATAKSRLEEYLSQTNLYESLDLAASQVPVQAASGE